MELELKGTIKTKHYNSVENGYDENITFCNEKGEYIALCFDTKKVCDEYFYYNKNNCNFKDNEIVAQQGINIKIVKDDTFEPYEEDGAKYIFIIETSENKIYTITVYNYPDGKYYHRTSVNHNGQWVWEEYF